MGDQERDNLSDKIDTLIDLHKKHDEKLTSVDDLLRGTYERAGLITRVASLEQTEIDRKCWYRLTVGAAITSASATISAMPIAWCARITSPRSMLHS